MFTFINKSMLLSVLLFLFITDAVGQKSIDRDIDFYRFVSEVPQNCEDNSAHLATLQDLLSKNTNQNSVLIVIAHLGSGETQRRYNQRRLYNVKKSLNIPEKNVVLAEGERVKGFGKVEVYWKGELLGVFFVSRNRDLCVDCCEEDKRFYPHKDYANRRKAKR
jgi:hypothetical protein